MSRNGDFLFTDHSFKKSLYVIKSDGTLKHEMSVNSYDGFDKTFVNEKTIVITTGQSPRKTVFDVIDIENRTKIKFINLPGRPYGITCDNDALFVCLERRGIFKVNAVDYTTSSVISCNLFWFSYVSVFADKINHIDLYTNSVVCCDQNGSCIWTSKTQLDLKHPTGVTVDNVGNVYVVREYSSTVVIISKDGKNHMQILTKGHGLLIPTAIFFDKQRRELFIANDKQSALLFNVRLK